MWFLIRIDAGNGVAPYYELRESEAARDACIAQILGTHPEFVCAWDELPADAPRMFTLQMRDAVLPRDPGRGQ